MNIKNDVSIRFLDAISELIRANIIASNAEFASRLGISSSMITEISKGRSSVGVKAIQNIVSDFGISAHWLLTGEGEMLADGRQSTPVATPSSDPEVGIPLIDIEAMTDGLTIPKQGGELYVVPAFKGANFLVQVKGTGMYPKYGNGDIVACQTIPTKDLFFQWGKVYVLSTSQGALVKRVRPGSDAQHVTLVSDNEGYEPFELPLTAIHGVSMVIGLIRME